MRYAVAVALIMSLPFTAAMADVYRSHDAQGHVQYSDTPTPGAELVHVQKLGQESATTSSNAPPASSGREMTVSQKVLDRRSTEFSFFVNRTGHCQERRLASPNSTRRRVRSYEDDKDLTHRP